MSIFATLTNISIMSEKELNAYRFSPEQEPTDEMLEQIMREVAEEARISNQKATEEHWKQMRQNVLTKQAKWAKDIELRQDIRHSKVPASRMGGRHAIHQSGRSG